MQPGKQEKQVPIRGLYTVTRILKKNVCLLYVLLFVSLRICCLALEMSHGTGVWSFTWMACQAAKPSLDNSIVANASQIYTLNFGVWMCQVSSPVGKKKDMPISSPGLQGIYWHIEKSVSFTFPSQDLAIFTALREEIRCFGDDWTDLVVSSTWSYLVRRM